MKDFSEWLDELTGELQEPKQDELSLADLRAIHDELQENRAPTVGDYWIVPGGWGIVDDSFLGIEPEPKADGPGYMTSIHEQMELSVKILDRYRRNPYQWMESDENE